MRNLSQSPLEMVLHRFNDHFDVCLPVLIEGEILKILFLHPCPLNVIQVSKLDGIFALTEISKCDK